MNEKLSRREREIMDIILANGEVTAEEVRQQLTDPPSYSTARAMLSRLEAKGYIRHKEKGMRYVYSAAISRSAARESAAKRLVKVFYEGSLAKAVTGLVTSTGEKLSDEELKEIEDAIAAARPKTKKRRRKR
jgi:predicted transcriptional regulator